MNIKALALVVLLIPLGATAADGKKAKLRSGEEIYTATCAMCHKDGVADAPKVGDRARWAPLIKEGLKELTTDAIKGKGAMPPKGGDPKLTRAEIARAIVFMANQSGAQWKEPK